MPASGKKVSNYIRPMLATATDEPFDSDEWLFELKLDGYRAIAVINPKQFLLYSRNGLNLATKYAPVAAALKKMNIDAVLDGEIVALNEEGKPDFQALQNYGRTTGVEIVYYVFDILFLKRKNLEGLPLLERKKILKKTLKRSSTIIYCDHILSDGKKFFAAIKKQKMEGIMAKKKDSLYHPAIRTKEWLKIKYNHSQEAIIIGYTAPRGSRNHFGSLLLAEYRKNKLHYIGHTGTGFNEKTLAALMTRMKKYVVAESPVSPAPKANDAVTWVKPVLVCEVKFTEITKEGILRHPVFKGLRADKSSKSITEETQKEVPVRKLVHLHR